MRKLGSSIAAFTLAMANWVDCTMTQICAADAPRATEMRAADDYYPYYLLGNPDSIPTATSTDYSQSPLDWSRGCGYLGHCPGMSAAADDSCSEDSGSYDEELDCRGDVDGDDEDSLAESPIDDSIPAPEEASYADDEEGYQAEDDYSEPSYSEPNYSEADDEGAYAADYGDDDASPQSPASDYESDYNYDGYESNYDYSSNDDDDSNYDYSSNYGDDSNYDDESSYDDESNYGDESSYEQQAADDDASEMIADDEEAAIAADESTTEHEATGEDDYVPSDEPCYGDYWTREYAAPAPAPATVEPAPQPNYGYDYENEYGDYEYNDTSDWSPEYAAPAEEEAPIADAGESWEDYSEEAELAPLDDTAPIAPAPVNDGDERLAEVVDAWATLPAPVKTVIMAMVKLSGSTR